MHKILITGSTLGLCALVGCSSTRSTMLTRDESNTAWQLTKSKGVPITLSVLTHVQVTVIDKQFLTLVDSGKSKIVERLELKVPVRGVTIDPIRTDKVMTVDFVRPAAGTFKMGITMDPNKQYFQEIQNELEDKTINEIGGLLGKLAPGGFFNVASSGGETVDPMVKQVDSVVAVEVFEVDSPTFEHDVRAFLNCHLNKAHDAYVVPAPAELNRVGLSGNLNAGPELCPLDPNTIWNGAQFCPPSQ